MRIIGFNGPPRSGKDTLAKAIEYIHDDEVRFKPYRGEGFEPEYTKWAGPWGRPENISFEALIMPCRVAAFSLLGLGEYQVITYERIKDQPLEQLGGSTLRQFMIALSEDFLKKNYGRGFYGESLKSKLMGSPSTIYNNDLLLLVTDVGFQEEVDILSELVGPENFLLVHTVRRSTTFENDSRGWCYHENQFKTWNSTPTPESGAYRIMMHANAVLGWEF